MITKLDIKNKLKNIFVFYQVEEREKRKEKKNIHQGHTALDICPSTVKMGHDE
jgi:hypothetical protein